MHCATSNMTNRGSAYDRALQALRKVPRPILAATVVFAIGLGANTAFFTIDFSRSLDLYSHSNQLVTLRPHVQAGDFIRLRKQATVFQNLNASTEASFRITTRDGQENVASSLVTPGFYHMMGDSFYLGGDFIPEDEIPGGGRVVIFSHSMWNSLGSNRAIIGSTLLMDGEPYTVVGVLAPGVRDRGASLTVPLVFKHDDQQINVIGRLNPGVSIREAQADVNAVGALVSGDQGLRVSRVFVEPMQAASLLGEGKFVLWLMLGVVGFVFLIASVGVVNLLRVRSEAGYRFKLSAH
jgi:putative ABC transport system permease protein